jgi:hypothetical protein
MAFGNSGQTGGGEKMRTVLILCIGSLYGSLVVLGYQLNMANSKLQLVETHLNIAGQKIQNLDYEISVLTDLQKEMKQ